MGRLMLTAAGALAAVATAFAATTGYHVIGDIQIGGEGGWDYLTADATARRLYVSHATHVVVVDLDSNKVVGDIPDTPGVHGIAIAPELNRGFISDGRGNTVTIFDLKTLKTTGTKKYSLSPCDGPSGLAIDTKSRRLFSVCSNRLMAISDPDAGKVVATPAIGAGSDGAAFDAGTGYAFSSNGDGTLTVVRQTDGKWDVLENIATERGARTIAVDEKTHKVYLPTARSAPSPSGGRATFLPNTFKVLVVGK